MQTDQMHVPTQWLCLSNISYVLHTVGWKRERGIFRRHEPAKDLIICWLIIRPYICFSQFAMCLKTEGFGKRGTARAFLGKFAKSFGAGAKTKNNTLSRGRTVSAQTAHTYAVM